MAITKETYPDGTEVTTLTGPDLDTVKERLAEAAWGPSAGPDNCRACKESFSAKNVHTAAGWAETKLSGLCEDCWDAMAKEFSDEHD